MCIPPVDKTLYHESMLCFYEACSMDTLRNAFEILQEWNVIKLDRRNGKQNKTTSTVQLLQPYQVRTRITYRQHC